jgi:hypothetical protein
MAHVEIKDKAQHIKNPLNLHSMTVSKENQVTKG